MHPEADIQSNFIKQVRLLYPNLLVTISPAGMILSPGMAMRMVRLGYKKGTPDVMIFEPRGMYFGMFIEFKTKNGPVSKEQKSFLLDLHNRGYHSVICRSSEEALQLLKDYLTLSSPFQDSNCYHNPNKTV